MKILSYIIPKALQNNAFMRSLEQQCKTKGELSTRQVWALRDMLDIDEEFFDWDYRCLNELHQENYKDLKNKLKRDKFRSVKGKNKCIRAMQSIIDGKPDHYLIREALGLDYQPRRYWR